MKIHIKEKIYLETLDFYNTLKIGTNIMTDKEILLMSLGLFNIVGKNQKITDIPGLLECPLTLVINRNTDNSFVLNVDENNNFLSMEYKD